MEHAAETPVNILMRDATLGKTKMDGAIMDQVASDVRSGLDKQLNGGPKEKFKLRMSNIGRPWCQLWHEKNKPEAKEPYEDSFLMNMMLGDIVETVFKSILRMAKVGFKDNGVINLDLGGGRRPIRGEYDLIINERVDDIKSASDYSYMMKFVDLKTLQSKDPFGYVAQLVGYAVGAGKKVGGWWVVNKANGKYKYVSAKHVNVEAELDKMRATYDYLENDKPMERCYSDEPETYYKKASGNRVLCKECGWCSFKKTCWPDYKQLPSKTYKGNKTAPLINYTQLKENTND